MTSAMVSRHRRVRRPSQADAFKVLVDGWASKIGVRPRRVQIQRMTTKWASCSTSGRISFSTDLLKEDCAFQEAVIVHELLHLYVPNHGKLFKSTMNAFIPDWEAKIQGRAKARCGFDK